MTNPYLEYYTSQAGTGLAGFQGVKYQKGHGFFGRILSNAVFPLLRFFGKRAAGVGADIASDVLLNKKDFKESAKERLSEEGNALAKVGIDRVKKFVQNGKGKKSIKRKRLELESLINQNGGRRKKKKKRV